MDGCERDKELVVGTINGGSAQTTSTFRCDYGKMDEQAFNFLGVYYVCFLGIRTLSFLSNFREFVAISTPKRLERPKHHISQKLHIVPQSHI